MPSNATVALLGVVALLVAAVAPAAADDIYHPAPKPSKPQANSTPVTQVVPGASGLRPQQIRQGVVVQPAADARLAARRRAAARRAAARRRAAKRRRAERLRADRIADAGAAVASTKLQAATRFAGVPPVASDRGSGGGDGSPSLALVLAIGLPLLAGAGVAVARARRSPG